MSIKKVADIKNKGLLTAGLEWATSLNLKDLTTREWDLAVELATSFGLSDKAIRKIILSIRKNGWKFAKDLLENLTNR